MSSFYQSGSIETSPGVESYLETATLLEDILLPELPPFPTMKEIHEDRVYYPRTEELYTDVFGKFSIPILTPLGDNTGDPKDEDITVTARNIVNPSCNIKTSAYKDSNFVELNIPKYIVLNFLTKIPKGTKFIVAFLGGSTSLGDIRVIGVSESAEPSTEAAPIKTGPSKKK